MQLVELEVRHWRGLNAKIGPLVPGLNAVFGPNESGKSRLVEALWFAIGESHKGQAEQKKALQSWTSGESPWVRVVFLIGEVRYTLTKQYLKKASAELAGGGKTLRDDDAEAALRQLFSTRENSGRKSNEADLGLWPLLIVRQGTAGTPPADVLNPDSRDRLQSALSAEIGAAAVSASGTRLLERAQAERDRYWTATGKPTKDLAAAIRNLEDREAALTAARTAYDQQVSTATQLAAKRLEHQDLQKRVGVIEAQARAARERADAAEAAANQLELARGRQDLARVRLETARTAIATHEQLQQQLENERTALARIQAEIERLAGDEQGLASAAAAARETFQAAEGRVDAARRTEQQARDAEQARRLDDDLKRMREKLAKVDEAHQRLAAARAGRQGLLEITDVQLIALRTAEQALTTAVAKLAGAAVRVTITPEQAISIGGQSRAAGEPVSIEVVDEQRIHLDGIASIDVRPTLGTLGSLREARDKAKRNLDRLLEDRLVTSVRDAEDKHAEWNAAAQKITDVGREIAAMSDQSPEALREEVLVLEEQRLLLGDSTGAPAMAEAVTALREAEQALSTARQVHSQIDNRQVQHREQLVQKRQSADEAGERVTNAQRRLDREPTADALREVVAGLEVEAGEAARAVVSAQSAFETLGGTGAKEDADRHQRALDGLLKRAGEIKTAVDGLQAQLALLLGSARGAGSYEALGEAETQRDAAKLNLCRIQARADAARRLHQVLTAARDRVVEQLAKPVVARIQPYLNSIFPGSTPAAGSGLTFDGLQTRDQLEDFAALSGGAKEQFALVTRIGIAEVLAGDDRLPLILDDSLVNSDPERVQRLHRVLDRASKGLQVILLSCNEALFDGLGAEYQVRLERAAR